MAGDPRPPFEPGNPTGALSRGGRPRKTDDVREAEAWGASGGRVLDVLKQLYEDARGAEKATERTAAAHEFLDRVLGKAAQPLAITGEDGGPLRIESSLAAFDAAIARLETRPPVHVADAVVLKELPSGEKK